VREPELRPCNLADCIDEAIHLLQLDPEAPSAHFDNRCHRELLVAADQQLLLQVFINLLDNARTAAPPGSAVVIDAGSDGDRARITVDNDGAVIPEGIMGKVFEPFFTTKDVGEGTGLGLSLVRSMVEDMAGDISLASPRPAPRSGGTRATLLLPRSRYGGSE
jgi:signal transduction histidine kinase